MDVSELWKDERVGEEDKESIFEYIQQLLFHATLQRASRDDFKQVVNGIRSDPIIGPLLTNLLSGSVNEDALGGLMGSGMLASGLLSGGLNLGQLLGPVAPKSGGK